MLMLNEALKKIWNVQKVDTAIQELQRKFDSIDTGAKIKAVHEQLKARLDEADGRLHAIRAEIKDLELQSKQIEEKSKKEQSRLYAGGIYNAKDAEAIERELKNLKERSSAIDERILILWEQVEPVTAEVNERRKEFDEIDAKLKNHLEKYAQVKAEFDKKMSQLIAMRNAAAKHADPDLLQKYDAVRVRHGGVGLAEVINDECGACHARIARYNLERIASGDSLEKCESCDRLLFINSDP